MSQGTDAHEPPGGAYELRRRCDNCGSDALAVYGAALDAPDIVHPLQLRCRTCGLVMASPRLTRESLAELYARFESEWSHAVVEPGIEERKLALARELVADIRRRVPGGRLLDVGSGTGAFLSVAAAEGFDVTGVELSQDGVEQARQRYGLEVRRGTIEDAGLPDEAFDVVFAWHVVEHVADLDGFVRELRRVLVPGGLLVVGTESYAHPFNAVVRTVRHATGRVPRIATSSLHTYVFTAAVLRDCFERRGFRTVEVRTLDERPLREVLRHVGARNRAIRSLAQGLEVAMRGVAAATRRGPYLRGTWTKA